MNTFRTVFLAILFCIFLPLSANAATCFWFSTGNGNWDNTNTANWFASTGGTGGACAATGGIPKNSADIATFDAASCNPGPCTITVCGAATANCPSGSGSLNLGSAGGITFSACTNTCVLDFSAINPAVTIGSLTSTGSGTRTLHMGSGTWTVAKGSGSTIWSLSGATNLTFDAGTSTINFTGTGGEVINLGTSTTYNVIGVGPDSTGGQYIVTGTTPTIATWNVTAPANIVGSAAVQNFSVTNAPMWTGSSSNIISFGNNTGSTAAFTITTTGSPTCSWCVFRTTTFSGATMNATNSFNLGGNTAVTITGPAGGGPASIIGG